MSTASRNCWFHLQRLQAVRNNARSASESFAGGPWALGSKRLQWLTNITIEFKIAALLHRGFEPFFFKSIFCWQEAMGGHSPPLFSPLRAPP